MPCNCIVVMREVWDTRDLLDNVVGADGALNTGALSQRIEPEDLNSLEQALQLKDKFGGKVTCVSIGQPRDVDVLREALYRGVDEVVRVVPPAGETPDTAAQAELLAAAIRKLGAFDLVLLGVNIPDGDNSLLGAELSARLGMPHISYVDSLTEVAADAVVCKREIEMGSEFIRAALPAVLVLGVYLLKDDPRTPRAAKAMLKLKMKKAAVPEWSAADLGLADLAAVSRVKVARYEAVPARDIQTVEVDPENANALQAMLAAVQQ